MDMLEIGGQPANYSWGGPGLSVAEARSHFTLWTVLKSPLLLGADASLMPPPILAILNSAELRAIHQDRLGVQARPLGALFYPGYHADHATAAVLRPCNATDPQQLWGSSYSSSVDMPVAGVTAAPVARVRNSGSVTHCLSVPRCQPNGSTPLTLRQCEDWTGDTCKAFPNFPAQVFQRRSAPVAPGVYAHAQQPPVQLLSNLSLNNTNPLAPRLCLSAPVPAPRGSEAVEVVTVEVCEADSAATSAADRQRWWWDVDPATTGDAHPDHPGTLVRSVGREGM